MTRRTHPFSAPEMTYPAGRLPRRGFGNGRLLPAAEVVTQMVPVLPKPSAYFVAPVRSNSRPATNGPRSITRTRTVRPRWRMVTFVPHGSVLCATPSVPTPSLPPQARRPP